MNNLVIGFERLLNQREFELENRKEDEYEPATNLEPVVACEVIHVSPNSEVPNELKEIQVYWKEEADFYGDIGSCVLGAGFEFNYKGQGYFMPPQSIWQGSISWEHCREEIEQKLKEIGATDIQYEWGRMD